jgi:hypothetical protein
MSWTKASILQELKRRHRDGLGISYNHAARSDQSLVSAAAYHFGSYRKAVEAAGFPYAEVVRRPRWTRIGIIQLIKKARRDGHDLHWGAVTRRGDELARAAFAAVQKRLFGGWDRALHAAGLDADDISPYRSWDKQTILFELRSRHRDGEPVNSGAVQSQDTGLHAAAVRQFGKFDAALKAAGIEPEAVRVRQSWSRPRVIAALKALKKSGNSLSDTAVRRSSPALYGAAIRQFGAFPAARQAAGLTFRRAAGKTKSRKSA